MTLPLSGVTAGIVLNSVPPVVGRVEGWAEVVSEYPRIYVEASGEMSEILSSCLQGIVTSRVVVCQFG